jgi:CheY-like chemotaxis protein/nitrogen-specific signal transduction histidine kinase
MTTIEISDLINTALLSGSHMINLLNDILNISKNKHLAHTIIVDNVIYQTLCFESVDCLKSLAENQHIKFKCEILPNEEKIVIATDRTKVIQIVSNILNNAIKFAGNGSITTRFLLLDTPQEAVEAWAADAAKHAGTVFSIQESQMFTSVKDVKKRTAGMPKNKSENWMFVSVADSGCGMRPDELASMFEPYTQASNDSNRTFQGTGLGLFICVSLCLRLDGFIACSSTFDVGTNFCIGIPVEIPTESAATLTGNDELISDNTASSSPIRIHGPVLVVDDNVVNVKILHRALTLELTKSGLPIEVITGDGGGVAIQSYKERRPSLIIIDYHMPEIDGMAATKAIREYEKAESLPPAYIITYTADATDDAAQVLLDNGSDEIMPKPPPKGFIKILVGRFDMKA